MEAADHVSEAELIITVIRKDGSRETYLDTYKRPWWRTLKRRILVWRQL